MYAREFRIKAKEACLPYSKTLALIEFLIFIALIILSSFAFIPLYIGIVLSSIIVLLIVGSLEFSYIEIAKNIKAKKDVKVEDIFNGFKRFKQSFLVTLISVIFIFLWSLLLIVPGIIKAYAYSMAKFISHDDEKIKTQESIKTSVKIMYGYKWRYFCLQISYIGWFLLSILTLGILGFWVVPKYRQASYEFYLYISNHPINNPIDKKKEAKTTKIKNPPNKAKED